MSSCLLPYAGAINALMQVVTFARPDSGETILARGSLNDKSASLCLAPQATGRHRAVRVGDRGGDLDVVEGERLLVGGIVDEDRPDGPKRTVTSPISPCTAARRRTPRGQLI
jgi:hypothetical protein